MPLDIDIKHSLLCLHNKSSPEIWGEPLNFLRLMTEQWWQASKEKGGGGCFFFSSYVPDDNWICNEIPSILIHIWILWFHILHGFFLVFFSPPRHFIQHLTLKQHETATPSAAHKPPGNSSNALFILWIVHEMASLFMYGGLFTSYSIQNDTEPLCSLR